MICGTFRRLGRIFFGRRLWIRWWEQRFLPYHFLLFLLLFETFPQMSVGVLRIRNELFFFNFCFLLKMRVCAIRKNRMEAQKVALTEFSVWIVSISSSPRSSSGVVAPETGRSGSVSARFMARGESISSEVVFAISDTDLVQFIFKLTPRGLRLAAAGNKEISIKCNNHNSSNRITFPCVPPAFNPSILSFRRHWIKFLHCSEFCKLGCKFTRG